MTKRQRRQQSILNVLATEPTSRVKSLAAQLEVTTETIRRDLEDLAQQGLIARTYGGAMLRRAEEPVLKHRERVFVREREAIARVAMAQIAGGRSFMIGSGATTTAVARRIAFELRDVTAIVQSVATATALSENPTILILMLPGEYHAGEGAVHGAQTTRFLQDYTADWAILGASALSPDGPSDALIEAGEVYRTMLRQTSRNIIVADHSKFDRMAAARYADWASIDHLASDRRPEGPLAQGIEAGKVELSIVPE